jgi:capsular exopolysaccharide synthesis family protein
LSLALARAGRDVILIDADMRRPAAAARLGVDPEASGLGQVLTGQVRLDEVLVEHDLGDQSGPGKLRILPPGPPPPNPSELIASQRMRELLKELEQQSDLVVLDTNPLLSVSDSLPLLDAVSGIVIVGRLNGTSKDAVRRLQRTIANAHGTMLGVVATNSVAGRIYGGYGYGYGYGSGSGYRRNGKKKGGALVGSNGSDPAHAESTTVRE